ncbi:S8 family peptidase [Natronoglycomyces albus]|uniref:S8 family serine peptidase n=1 Tax=Natronoglycomyces albus TaxID=2811108 RepID=A0A895XTT7_9ACTN|nr:S8 family serine peptidase [Natronoglycomyces albus]QSB05936.1 S8 family serine peptidase [Natronoglycomyces albus]
MRLMFTDHAPRIESPNPRRDRMSGVPSLSTPTLNRHHGRVLRPGHVVKAPQSPEPVGTIYRYDRLLVDSSVFEDEAQCHQLGEALEASGMSAAATASSSGGKLCRRVPLELSPNADPGTIDAWRVLQSIRRQANEGTCDAALADRVRLEHLMVAASDNSRPGIGGPEPINTNLLRPQGRVPVDMVVPMPTRRSLDDLNGRRLRVAVLDTGVAQKHPALSIADWREGGDPFVVVDSEFQQTLGADADPALIPLDSPWDEDVHNGDLIAEVASHYGHGTFMAGILRQTAPDVQVYSLRVMHNDGLAFEREVVAALEHVADQVEAAYAGDTEALGVDMVILSLGYVDEDPTDDPGGWMADIVTRLSRLGIPVVAAAGNQSSERPFYPAAFATRQSEALAPVLSVGALNPNGNIAMFSNDGPWVSCFASGASVVSTFPPVARGSLSPYRRVETDYAGRYRESLDPDDFSSGFAVWSGTSFAAPLAAAYLANEMEKLGPAPTVAEAMTRSQVALKKLKQR